MYMVTAIRDVCEENGVEVVGIFDTEEKAYKAKAKVEKWMKDNEYEDYVVFVNHTEINQVTWYEINEKF